MTETITAADRLPKPGYDATAPLPENLNRTPLTANDRCDQCGAQAYHRVIVNNTPLLFCHHHGQAHRDRLILVASDWFDESEKLTKPKETARATDGFV